MSKKRTNKHQQLTSFTLPFCRSFCGRSFAGPGGPKGKNLNHGARLDWGCNHLQLWGSEAMRFAQMHLRQRPFLGGNHCAADYVSVELSIFRLQQPPVDVVCTLRWPRAARETVRVAQCAWLRACSGLMGVFRYKVLVVGENHCGKTSIIKRCVFTMCFYFWLAMNC